MTKEESNQTAARAVLIIQTASQKYVVQRGDRHGPHYEEEFDTHQEAFSFAATKLWEAREIYSAGRERRAA